VSANFFYFSLPKRGRKKRKGGGRREERRKKRTDGRMVAGFADSEFELPFFKEVTPIRKDGRKEGGEGKERERNPWFL